MPEPLAIVTAVASLLASTWKVSQTLYTTISGIQKAPKHIRSVSVEVESLHTALSKLQTFLDALAEQNPSTSITEIFSGLQYPLECSLRTLSDLQAVINQYIDASGKDLSKLKATLFHVKEEEILRICKDLDRQKATLHMTLVIGSILIQTKSYELALESRDILLELRDVIIQRVNTTSDQDSETQAIATCDYIVQRSSELETDIKEPQTATHTASDIDDFDGLSISPVWTYLSEQEVASMADVMCRMTLLMIQSPVIESPVSMVSTELMYSENNKRDKTSRDILEKTQSGLALDRVQ